VKEQAVGANGLIAMMGHNHRLAPNERKEERKHCWAGQKDLIGTPDQLPQMPRAGLSNNAEWTA